MNARREVNGMRVKLCCVILAINGLFIAGCGSSEEIEERNKRQAFSPFLAFPYGGSVKMIIGIGVPIIISGRNLAYGQNVQYQYPLPSNISYLSQLFSRSTRRRRSTPSQEREIVYHMLQKQFDRDGVDGKECIMRGICETAETPIREQGLIGELLHLLLTPDYGGNNDIDEEFLNAKKAGQRGENCMQIYSGCPEGRGILDYVSTTDYA